MLTKRLFAISLLLPLMAISATAHAGATRQSAQASTVSSPSALNSAFAYARANTVHHKSAVGADRDAVGLVLLHPNYGNPNGNPDGPTTLSGTGDSQFGGSSPGTSGYN